MTSFEILSLACTFATVFLVVGQLTHIAFMPRVDLNQLTRQNRERVLELRKRYFLYLLFEPVLGEIANSSWVSRIVYRRQLKKFVEAGSITHYFAEDELTGIVWIRSLVVATAVAVLIGYLSNISIGILMALFSIIAYSWYFAFLCREKIARRNDRLVRRLPAVTDLLAMQLKAGLQFRPAIKLAAEEMSDHPVGEEFSKVMSDNERGLTMDESLQQMSKRLSTSDIKEFVDAILAAKKRGTPLARTLTNLSQQMRVRRTQRAERAAGRAQANITFPGLVIMGACLLILLAPFVLQAVKDNPFDF